MATNAQVVKAWAKGRRAKSSNGNLSTDGKDLFSYRMRIGRTLEHEFKQALNVSGRYSYSLTTSKHVSLARGYAHEIINPVIRNQWREFP